MTLDPSVVIHRCIRDGCSFAKEPYKRDDILQKRLVILMGAHIFSQCLCSSVDYRVY